MMAPVIYILPGALVSVQHHFTRVDRKYSWGVHSSAVDPQSTIDPQSAVDPQSKA